MKIWDKVMLFVDPLILFHWIGKLDDPNPTILGNEIAQGWVVMLVVGWVLVIVPRWVYVWRNL